MALSIPGCKDNHSDFTPAKQLETADISGKYLGCPALIILDQERVEVSGNSLIKDSRIIKKIIQSGSREEAVFRFSENSYREVVNIEGRALYPDGRQRIMEFDDVNIEPEYRDFVLYSDQRSYVMEFPGAVSGTLIECRARIKINNLIFWEDVWFQDDIPILEKEYRLVYPSGLDFDIRSSLTADVVKNKASLGDGRERITWRQKDIKQFEFQPMMPPGINYIPSLSFFIKEESRLSCTLKPDSWKGIAEWYRKISEERIIQSDGVHSLVRKLSPTGMKKLDSARRIYRWVQNNIRYVAVYFGDGGIVPNSTTSIFDNRYGDCKDMAVLLTSMLREAGIGTSLVLVRTSDLGCLSKPLPSPRFFNHAIVLADIEGDRFYLDPTCKTCGFGTLPAGDRGAAALVIRGGEDSLAVLPFSQAGESRSDFSMEAVIDDDGDAAIDLRMVFSGDLSSAMRDRLLFRRGRSKEKIISTYVKNRIPDLEIWNVAVDGEKLSSESLTIRVSGTLSVMISEGRRYSAIRTVFDPVSFTFPRCRGRRYPIWLGNPRTTRGYEIILSLPTGWKATEIQPSGKLQNDYFDYIYSSTNAGEKVNFSRIWTDKGVSIPASECSGLRDLLENVRRVEESRTLISRVGK